MARERQWRKLGFIADRFLRRPSPDRHGEWNSLHISQETHTWCQQPHRLLPSPVPLFWVKLFKLHSQCDPTLSDLRTWQGLVTPWMKLTVDLFMATAERTNILGLGLFVLCLNSTSHSGNLVHDWRYRRRYDNTNNIISVLELLELPAHLIVMCYWSPYSPSTSLCSFLHHLI